MSNDSSIHAERVTFGEYPTTTKVNGVLSSLTPSIDAIPSAEAEFGDYNVSTSKNEDYNMYSNVDTFQRESIETSNYNDFNTNTNAQYGTSEDVLQATNSYGEIGTNFEENDTIEVDGLRSGNIHPIDAFPPGGDFIDDNNYQTTETNLDLNTFQSDNQIMDSGANYGDFQTTETTTSPYVDTGVTYDNFQSTDTTYATTTNYEGITNQYDTSAEAFQATSSTDDTGAQFGEYRTTTKVNGVESTYMPNIDALPSADSLLETNDYTTSAQITDTNTYENTTASTFETNTNFGVNEYTSSENYEYDTNNYQTTAEPFVDTTTNYNTTNYVDNNYNTGEYVSTNYDTTTNYETTTNFDTTNYDTTANFDTTNYDTTTKFDTTTNYDTTTNFATTTNYDTTTNFDTTNYETTANFDTTNYDTTANYDNVKQYDTFNDTTNYDTTVNINTETKYDIPSQNFKQADYSKKNTTYETTPSIDINTFTSSEPIVDTTTNYDTSAFEEYTSSNKNYKTSQVINNAKQYETKKYSTTYSTPVIETDLTTFTKPVPSIDITPAKTTTAFTTISQKPKVSTTPSFDIDSYLLKEPIVDTTTTKKSSYETTNYSSPIIENIPKVDVTSYYTTGAKTHIEKKYNSDSNTITTIVDPFPQIKNKSNVEYQPSSPDLDLLNLDKYTSNQSYSKSVTFNEFQATNPAPNDMGLTLGSYGTYGEYKAEPKKAGASFGEYDTITMSKTYSPSVEPTPKQTTIITLPPKNPIYIKQSDPIVVKVPSVQQVIVPKVQKVYIPNESKIYIPTSSAVTQHSYHSVPHRSRHSHVEQVDYYITQPTKKVSVVQTSVVDPNISLVPIPKIKQSKSLVPIPKLPGSQVLVSQVIPQPTITQIVPITQVNPSLSTIKYKIPSKYGLSFNPSDPNSYIASHSMQGRRRHRRMRPGRYISRAYKPRKL